MIKEHTWSTHVLVVRTAEPGKFQCFNTKGHHGHVPGGEVGAETCNALMTAVSEDGEHPESSFEFNFAHARALVRGPPGNTKTMSADSTRQAKPVQNSTSSGRVDNCKLLNKLTCETPPHYTDYKSDSLGTSLQILTKTIRPSKQQIMPTHSLPVCLCHANGVRIARIRIR